MTQAQAQDFMPDVISALSRGSVLALGPGCRRIGFDESIEGVITPWDTVVDRMRLVNSRLADEVAELGEAQDDRHAELAGEQRFLQRYLWSKLSDEARSRRATNGDVVDEAHRTVRGHGEPVSDVDRWRTVVARHLLGALVGATQLLGRAIEEDRSPVIEWVEVRVSRVRSAPSGGAGRADAERDPAFDAVARHLHLAQQVLQALKTGTSTWPATIDDDGLAQCRRDIGDGPLHGEDKQQWKRLQPANVATLLETLATLCFDRQRPDRQSSELPSGATVEWLSDLFWHWIVRGSGLPPSEADLAFYLDLRAGDATDVHRFRRPRPGEVRAGKPTIAAGLREIMAESTRTATEQVAAAQQAARAPGSAAAARGGMFRREQVMLSIAASLAVTGQRHRIDPQPRLRSPIALVSGYDLSLETAIMRTIEPGRRFHVIMPARLDSEHKPLRLVWLIGTFTRPKTTVGNLAAAVQNATWRPVESIPPIDEKGTAPDDAPDRERVFVDEPIVVKLHGSPLHRNAAGDFVKDAFSYDAAGTYREELDERAWQRAGAFVAYTETEVLAVNAYLPELVKENVPGDPNGSLTTSLLNELSWAQRSWLLLGHRFVDWLTRLRVHALASTTRASSGNRDQPEHFAIDRAFGYPERGILDSLGMTLRPYDLGEFAEYWSDVDLDEHGPRQFVIDVAEVYGRALRGER